MDEDDKAAEQHTVAADEIGATSVAPKSAEAPPDLAWSLNDDDETVSPERQSWGLAWARAAVFALIGVVLAFVIGALGRALVRAHDDSHQAPSVAHRAAEVMPTTSTKAHAMVVASPTVTVDATPPTVTVKATPPTITVKAAPATITVEAAPTTVTLPAPISTVPFPGRSSVTIPGEVDTTYDQRFLDRMRSLGYINLNPPLMLRNAHEACRLFRQGEAAEQVNQQMSAQMGTNMTDTLQLTSSAMLAYPDCY